MPAALFVKYKDVKNLIDARIAHLTRKHSNDKESIKLCVDALKQEGFFSLLRFHENGPFLLSWVSPWQKKRSPITNKGVPVCFFITDREVLSTLEQWLTWLKSTFTLKVKKIMIDCSPTEIGAIRSVFGDAVQVLLCHWHIKRAWETHIKKDIKVDKATKQSENVRSAVRASLNSMMYAKSCEEFDLSVSLFNIKYKEYTSFVDYFNKLWVPKKQNWSQAWSQEASFHTNNLIESYHNQIKSFYLGRSRNLRVDHMLYLLTKVILVDYRQDSIRTYYGFQDAKLAAFEEKKRAKAYEINFDIACSMIEKIDEDVADSCISACSCPDTAKICKHIFLTSRITQIPFSLCFSLVEPLSDDLPDVEDSCDIDEAENLRLAEYLENIQKYHNSFNGIYQQKMSKIKSGMRMHT
ncbi:hypothetical protein RO3G_01045 [Rhizopus delemar RA 99-880]|uniref:SWIM-type domain-containing protein n=1 Tax=Rhizopus delemar (strain RA 99-880 / ATCC MYA-4621 / FGSC 9543 / NRRL 43880) TaxID=246409 RepID=I1BJG1_RHIO9|nr:hypothetical protein RO3G_01045 [Rhizopus delemar RA 99-880]|eukprot:EIE76341.1 hypothetical protein RO3G_01045 [Rhizopus delemar RA 99-880]